MIMSRIRHLIARKGAADPTRAQEREGLEVAVAPAQPREDMGLTQHALAEGSEAVKRQEFIIDGEHFTTMDGFYDEVERVFTLGLDWSIGRNLDAFNDVLRGGFGRHEYGDPIIIRWLHFTKSVNDLRPETMKVLEEIILDTDDSGHDCVLVKE
jgi:RNAse (barnase) inhibitor barstar